MKRPSRSPPHPNGKAAQATSMKRAQEHAEHFRILIRRLEIGAPELASDLGAGTIIEDIRAATRPAEWNFAVSCLVTWALLRAAPPDLSKDDVVRYRVVVGQLSFALAKGFVTPATRPPTSPKNVRYNADIIRFEGARTVAEAIDALDKWEQASLLPGQVLADFVPELSEAARKVRLKQRRDRIRKQVERADKAYDLGLKKRMKRG